MTKEDLITIVEHYVPVKSDRDSVLSAIVDYSTEKVCNLLEQKQKEIDLRIKWNTEGQVALSRNVEKLHALNVAIDIMSEK